MQLGNRSKLERQQIRRLQNSSDIRARIYDIYGKRSMTELGFPPLCDTEIAAAPRLRRESVGVRVGEGDARRDGRRRRADRRAVDDQHRHRRRRGDGAAGRGAGARRLGAGAHHRRPRRGRRRGAAHPRPARCQMGVDVPLIGDFHYIGHKLLADHPACAEALDKYRINPGNVGFKEQARPAVRRRSSKSRSGTASRCASAPTGARSTRSC